MACFQISKTLILVDYKQIYQTYAMTYGFTQIVGQTATPTVAAVTKSTATNIKKLKVYLRNETKTRQNTK